MVMFSSCSLLTNSVMFENIENNPPSFNLVEVACHFESSKKVGEINVFSPVIFFLLSKTLS